MFNAARSRILLLLACAVSFNAAALSFDLDSIAAKGKFARFCVNTYRWGDRFFNTYDTAYVKGTGYNMNIKLRSDSWFDYNNLYFSDHNSIKMNSPTNSTVGIDLTYMAVSLAYDLNINKLTGGSDRTKSKFNFDFSCALLSASFYSISNNIGMNITEYDGKKIHRLKCDGVKTSEWGIEANYFFNHKRYSYAAAFALSRLQQKSQGSFSLGLSYVNQNFRFDFSKLPPELNYSGPAQYNTRGQAFGIKCGYGHNWVIRRNITVGISESLVPSIVIGSTAAGNRRRCTFRLSNRFNASFVWNHDRWFLGVIVKNDAALFFEKHSALANGLLSITTKFGWRFGI